MENTDLTMTDETQKKHSIKKRFDAFLPIVIDVETGGANNQKDALLEIAAFLVEYDDNGKLIVTDKFHTHVTPFEGANLNPEAMKVNRIDPYHPFRFDVDEKEAITGLFEFTREALAKHKCRRAILVGHNAHFDLGFIQAAADRCHLNKNNPYHTYTVFDTATLGGVFVGKTVLAKAVRAAGLRFNQEEAHSAVYDAHITALLFCELLNRL